MMDELKLRQKVTDIIREGYLNDARAVVIMDDILSLIAPELEKAAKWDKVKEIADSDYCSRCFNRFQCPSDDYAPCPFKDILEEVEGGGDA